MLIVREAMIGNTRFSDFRNRLGIAPDILSTRLSSLVAAGVFEPVDYQEPGDRRRRRYELTEAGRELSTILVALAQWGRTHVRSGVDAKYRFIDATTHEPVAACLRRSDGEIADPADVVLAVKTG